MLLELSRTYYPNGTNSELRFEGKLVCFTIELPDLNNQRAKSCIPEGIYTLSKRYSKKFGWHLLVNDVPDRSLILFHPANNALKELKGCIAPVSRVIGAGVGSQSRKAFDKLKALVFPLLEENKTFQIHIFEKSVSDETTRKT